MGQPDYLFICLLGPLLYALRVTKSGLTFPPITGTFLCQIIARESSE